MNFKINREKHEFKRSNFLCLFRKLQTRDLYFQYQGDPNWVEEDCHSGGWSKSLWATLNHDLALHQCEIEAWTWAAPLDSLLAQPATIPVKMAVAAFFFFFPFPKFEIKNKIKLLDGKKYLPLKYMNEIDGKILIYL